MYAYIVKIEKAKIVTLYCKSEKDIIDIINNPEYGRLYSVERILIPKEGYYEFKGIE